MIATLCKIAATSATAMLAGLPLVTPARRRPGAGELAAAWTLALGGGALLALAAGLGGLSLPPATLWLILAGEGVMAAIAAVLDRVSCRGTHEPPTAPARAAGGPAVRVDDGGRALLWASRLALAIALAVLAVKLAQTPLWSWDHFAIWGVKARRMLVGDRLDLGFLPSLRQQSRTDHPLGLPMVWLMLTMGEPPTPAEFRVLHALFALALLAVLRAAAARLTSSAVAGNLAAAFLAASPLLWDSEAVGLAELPMALWASAAILVALPALPALEALLPPRPPLPPAGAPAEAGSPASTGSRVLRWGAAGLLIGFLPWVKQEGLVLAAVLLAALLLAVLVPSAVRARRAGPAAPAALALGAPVAILAAGALAVQRLVLPEEGTFFAGDWWHRGMTRLPQFLDIQRRCLALLLQADWLGFWGILAVATCVAAARRNGLALALAAVVWMQLLVYEATALFSYLEPAEHLDAAFFRISAALVPIGLLAMAALMRRRAS